MRNILGLDLGSNSVGWAMIEVTDEDQAAPDAARHNNILQSGSRIIPMDAELLSKFGKGNAISQTSERTAARSMRRRKERFKQRRERLNRVLALLGWLPPHYAKRLDRYGKVPDDGSDLKLAWTHNAAGEPAFLFEEAFEEMVALFHKAGHGTSAIPRDWTLYYLRTKGLREALTPTELAWVLHSFNAKRGYRANREELAHEQEEKDSGKHEELLRATIVDIHDTGQKSRGKTRYELVLEDSDGQPLPSCIESLDTQTYSVGQSCDVVITTQPQSSGKTNTTARVLKDDDWALIKARTEKNLDNSGLMVGAYIFQTLLHQPGAKIIGGLVSVIDRSYLRNELQALLMTQVSYHPQLTDKGVLETALEALYPGNIGHRAGSSCRTLGELLIEEIIFYQRPLRSKKSEIAECPYEKRSFIDSEGKIQVRGIKCIPVSHPDFQEFRLWQFIHNLRIYRRDDLTNTAIDLTPGQRENLFGWLNDRKDIKQDPLINKLMGRGTSKQYRWNYVEDRAYPANETRATLLARLKKGGLSPELLTDARMLTLWHIMYSVSDPIELEKALRKWARRESVPAEAFSKSLAQCPPFKQDYGAYSQKAIRRLLPLMRQGKYWSAEAIDPDTRRRIDCLITGEDCAGLSPATREQVAKYGLTESIEQFQGLPLWLACYIAYDRHAEAADVMRWETPDDLAAYLRSFRHHSLRNPVVEQVVLETLRVVRDVWLKWGHIDEIHLEMGRDLKSSNEERARLTKDNLRHERDRLRIKDMLIDFFNNSALRYEGIRPYSPMHIEKLRLYEEEAIANAGDELTPDIKSIRYKYNTNDEAKHPTAAEVERYATWLDQKCFSPYTNKPIPLSRLFTRDYEIEHVIPRSLYYDDSRNNKVICETEVNKLKDNRLGMTFIRECGGQRVDCHGECFDIVKEAEYTALVKQRFAANHRKQANLLADDIPQGFTSRQLNDSRYIARFMAGLLSQIVRERRDDGTLEAESRSKNLIICTGQTTDALKREWGLHDVWNALIKPRFERLRGKKDKKNQYGEWLDEKGRLIVPMEIQRKGFNKKRIDHRHHALDAIIIACTTRSMINYLSNLNAHDGAARQDLRRALCDKVHDDQGGYRWQIRKPWETFTQDTKKSLGQIVVSFKRNMRILTQTTNHYEAIDPSTGRKVIRTQKAHEAHYAVRKKMHKDSVYGEVNLSRTREVPLKKALAMPDRIVDKALRQRVRELKMIPGYTDEQVERYFKDNADPQWKKYDTQKIEIRTNSSDPGEVRMAARRNIIDTNLNVDKVTDTGIQTILKNHLKSYGNKNKADEAFSPEGLAKLNEHIVELNGGKPHHPIKKVRVSETMGEKRAIGEKGCRSRKFVEAAKGTNLYFGVYANEAGERDFATIPLRKVIERLQKKLPPVPENNGKGWPLAFSLSPNDLVYLPDEEERETGTIKEPLNPERIYKMVSSTGKQCFFIPHRVADRIVEGWEYNSVNKIEKIEENNGTSIKKHCLPLHVDRLGHCRLRQHKEQQV